MTTSEIQDGDSGTDADRKGRAASPWLRLESAAVALAAFYLYSRTGTSWWLFALLFLAPDLFMVGYLRGPQLGARVYNLGHVYAAPLLLAAVGGPAGLPYAVPVALIWTAHIAADRALGYGLKLPAGFRHTHLGAIGGGEHETAAPSDAR